MGIKCFIIGHKPKSYTDSGYEMCDRCECHEFYDGIENGWAGKTDKWLFTIPAMYYRRRLLFRNFLDNQKRKVTTKCYSCDKTETLLGKPYGDHEKCLPF